MNILVNAETRLESTDDRCTDCRAFPFDVDESQAVNCHAGAQQEEESYDRGSLRNVRRSPDDAVRCVPQVRRGTDELSAEV